MASIYSATTEGERALVAATARTVLHLVGVSTVKAKLVEWGISFDGIVSSDAPVVVRLLRQSTAGTTSVNCVEVKWDDDQPAAAVTCTAGFSSTEPVAGNVLATYEVHPQGGSLVIQYPLGREPTIQTVSDDYLGIECNSPAAVNCVAYMVWEE